MNQRRNSRQNKAKTRNPFRVKIWNFRYVNTRIREKWSKWNLRLLQWIRHGNSISFPQYNKCTNCVGSTRISYQTGWPNFNDFMRVYITHKRKQLKHYTIHLCMLCSRTIPDRHFNATCTHVDVTGYWFSAHFRFSFVLHFDRPARARYYTYIGIFSYQIHTHIFYLFE